jgi:hypothetical protein
VDVAWKALKGLRFHDCLLLRLYILGYLFHFFGVFAFLSIETASCTSAHRHPQSWYHKSGNSVLAKQLGLVVALAYYIEDDFISEPQHYKIESSTELK